MDKILIILMTMIKTQNLKPILFKLIKHKKYTIKTIVLIVSLIKRIDYTNIEVFWVLNSLVKK